jgi:hypothetical protein
MKPKNIVADFGDCGASEDIECCENCRWFEDDYPHAEGCPCMVDPPTVLIMRDMEGRDVCRTVRPIPKYPNRDFCSKFERKVKK